MKENKLNTLKSFAKLLKIALESRKYLYLLIVTALISLLVTLSSQIEAFGMGLLTSQGPDIFSIFYESKEKPKPKKKRSGRALNRIIDRNRAKNMDAKITLEDIQKKWPAIDTQSKGYIDRTDVVNYFGERKVSSNPLKKLMFKFKQKYKVSNNITLLLIILSFVGVFRVVCVFLGRYTTTLVGTHISKNLRERYFMRLQELPMSFYKDQNIGALSARITGEAVMIADSLVAFITNYLQMPFTFITCLYFLFKFSFSLTLIIFLGLPLIGLPLYILSEKVRKAQRKMQEFGHYFSQLLIDYLAGVQTVRMFNMEKFSAKKYHEMNTKSAKIEEKMSLYRYVSKPIIHLIGTFFLAVILIYGLYFAKMSVSDLVVYTAMLFLFYEPIKKFGEENVSIQRGLIAAESLNAIMNEQSEYLGEEKALEFPGLKQKLEFKDVWFKYNEAWVLKDLNFTVNKGEVVALVGATGAGKSTIAQLIPRLYDPQKGTIEIDGVSIENYKKKSVREKISSVTQKPFLFYSTVSSNICFGREFSQEEIEHAAKKSKAEEFINNLPQKYETQLAEMGKSLSGGQQQRLAIARALIKPADILILDEATSALDTICENDIKEAIADLKGTVTQIIIAHRLSTIQDADKIIYLEYGQKIAEGTRDELYENCEPFKLMWDTMFNREKKISSLDDKDPLAIKN